MGKRADIGLFAATVVACLVGLELAYRAASSVPILSVTDWSRSRIVPEANPFSVSDYDPVVGWVTKPGIASNWLNTIGYGVRKNRQTDTTVRTGGVLVVGDSFSAGSQVDDDQSWPAHLETELGQPVINAAVGGWGIDQMVLRIEQLQAPLQPRTVILGTQDQGILRVAFSSYGAPKPYFSIAKGKLVAHNQPVPKFERKVPQRSLPVRTLSYSYVAAQVMGKIDPDYWLTGDGQQFTRTGVDDVEVSCALLDRLKRSSDALSIRTVVLLQYGWFATSVAGGGKPAFAAIVSGCARQIGLEVVDTFEPLRRVAERDATEHKSLFVKGEGENNFGHMSDRGNRLVASLLAEQLRAPPPPPRVAGLYQSSHAEQRGDGINRVVAPENLESRTRIAELSAGGGWWSWLSQPDRSAPKRYTLTAAGPKGEHYLEVPVQADLPAGPYALSLRARQATTANVRVQLLDAQVNGAAVDFNLETGTAAIQRLGRASAIRAPVEELRDSWRQLTVMTVLPEKGARVVIQLLDKKGRPHFRPKGYAIEIGAVRLEAGRLLSSDQALSGH